MRLIDADALLDFIDVGHLRHPSELCFSEIDVANMLLHATTISPDEVRSVGKWEDVSVHDNIRNIMIASMRCNVCKRYHNEVYHYGDPTEMARFCPVCGAKMEVE